MSESDRAGGSYAIEIQAYNEVRREDFGGRAKARLTTWLVDQRRLGVERPRVTKQIADAAKHWPSLPMLERADRLLEFLGGLSEFAGEAILLEMRGSFTKMLAVSESVRVEEVRFLLDYLERQRLIEQQKFVGGNSRVKVTVDGYGRLFELEARTADTRQAFVAMWFDSSMNEVYETGFAYRHYGRGLFTPSDRPQGAQQQDR